jgi:ABC-type lipoprotein release transport system permease subunit
MTTTQIILAAVLAPLFIAVLVLAARYVLPVNRVPLRYNLRNLQVRWLTTLVTSVAVILIIALLTIMLMFVKGMDRLTEGSGNPRNVLIMSDGATDEAFSSLPGGFSFELLPADLQQYIVKTPDGKFMGSKEVYVIVTHMLPNPEPGGRKRRYVQMRGVDDPRLAAAVHDIELGSGQWFSSTGEPEIVLGAGVAQTFGRDYGKPALVPGDEVEIGPLKWKVTGIMKPSNSAFGSEIWTHDQIVQNRFGRQNSYSSYVVRTGDEATAKLAAVALKEFRSERALKAETEREYYAKLTATNDQFRYAAIFVAVIMAIGGALGVMITMFAAVSQRTKDIGMLRLLGYTRLQILCSFMLESFLVAIVGGLLGVGLAALADGLTANSTVSAGQGGGKSIVLQLDIDAWIVGIAMVFALVMGAVGGVIPSVNAMRLRPLESLR